MNDLIWYLTDAVWWPAHYGYGNRYGDGNGSGYSYGGFSDCYGNGSYGFNNGDGNGSGYYNYE